MYNTIRVFRRRFFGAVGKYVYLTMSEVKVGNHGNHLIGLARYR